MAGPTETSLSPNPPVILRKLATILSADVAGYSRLMAEDEEQTLLTFRAHSAVFDALVAQHHGRVFNRAGDAILAEFDSAVEAVRCATDIQAALQTSNAQLPENRRVQFRIGVNLGDVLRQGEDLLGDGVNVAARLQTAAAPGGICLSGSVYDQILNKLALSFKPMGEMSFKNIPQPVRTFSIVGNVGESVLPAPVQARKRSGAMIAGAALAAVLVLGGGLWFWSQHSTGPAAATAAATSVAATDAAGAFTGEIDGRYAGPICFGPASDDPARCFRAEATLEKGRFSGKWDGRDPGVTVILAGTVSATGASEIDVHGEKTDGTRVFRFSVFGNMGRGKLAAAGAFPNGRSVTLDWAFEN